MMSKKSVFARLEENVIASCLIIMTISIALNAVLRYLSPSLEGLAEEIALFTYIWACFLCMSYATKTGTNIIVDAISSLYGEKVQYILGYLQYITDIVMSAIFLYGSVNYVWQVFSSGDRGVTGIPLWIIYCGAIFGFLMALIRNVQLIMLQLKDKKENKTPEGEEVIEEGEVT